MPRSAWHVLLLAPALLLSPTAASAQTFKVTGRCEYVDKVWGWDGWTGEKVMLPIRRADVYVVDFLTNDVLGVGTTLADGSYTVSCLASGPAVIRVQCHATTDHNPAFQRLRVTNESNVVWALASHLLHVSDPPVPLDAGTMTALPMKSGPDEGQPFNVLDCGVAALEYALGPQVGLQPAPFPLRLTWPSTGGTWAKSLVGHIGGDDGYDDAVVLHEFGHLVHEAWSQDDSKGGPHWFGGSDQEPRLAFSEGFATCFAGAVLNSLAREAMYLDCNGHAVTGGVQLRLRLEDAAPWSALCGGEADEVAVACTLFDLLDDEYAADATPGSDDDGFLARTSIAGAATSAAWWSLFSGPLKQTVNLALQDGWDQWLLHNAADPHTAELTELFDARDIRFVNDEQEPDGTQGSAGRLHPVSNFSWSGEHTLYASTDDPPAPGTGDVDWYAVTLVKGDVVEVRTSYPPSATDAETECDPYLELFRPDGTFVAANEDGGIGRNALLPDVAITSTGDWLVKVGTHDGLRRYGRYAVRVQYLSQNHPPVIVSGPSAFPPVVRAGDSAMLSALARDRDGDEALEYAWTAVDGGVIAGTGASVTFVPPVVLFPKLLRVGLVVSDSLGAESAPGEASLLVLPMVGGTCEGSAAWLALGDGKPGLGGTPSLAALGQPVVPSLDFALQARGLTPLFPGYVSFGFTQLAAPFDGGTLWATPDLLLPVVPSSAGELFIPLLLPPEPLLCGLSVIAQVIVPGDPGAGGAHHTAQSNGLKVTFGD